MADFDGVRVCGVPDHFGSGSLCKWPDGDIRWTVVAVLPGFSEEEFTDCARRALDILAGVCGITPRFVESASQARILVGVRQIDGRMGVLAESELPCGQVRQCRQWYDTGESWVVSDNPPSNKIDLLRVMLHELCHALGMPHISDGNLMAPTYSRDINRPQTGDVAELQRRYGRPKTRPSEPPPAEKPNTPGGDLMNAILRGLLLSVLEPALAAYERQAKETPDPLDDVIAMLIRKAFDVVKGGDVNKVSAALAALESVTKAA